MRTTAHQPRDGQRARQQQPSPASTDRTERQRPVRRLQRQRGNQGVQRLVDEGVQPKLEVGSPNDRYEREADRVAREVTRPSGTVERPTREGSPERVQRMCTRCKERYRAGKSLDCPDCEKELQRKPEAGGGAVETAGLRSALDATGGGRELPDGVRSSFESKIGHDFGDVRVHDGGEAARLNDRLGAKAFTYGRDVYFGAGNYRPATRSGQKLLAHELTHVVQQTGAAPKRVQRQDEEDESGGGDRVVTVCDRNFNMSWDVPKTDWTIPFGDAVPARHCFVWYHDRSVPAEAENVVGRNTSTYDNTQSGTPDPAATDDSVKCRATYNIDPSCVRNAYQQLCSPDDYNLTTFNCCSCANRAIEACGGSTSSADFPSANQGIGLPEDYGGGWKRTALEGLNSAYQWGKSTVSETVEGVEEFGSDVRRNLEYMTSTDFIFDMQRYFTR